MYQFTEDCLIGIDKIDEEHRYLFQLINCAVEELASDHEDCVALTKNLLKKLKEYTVTHFVHEEEYMESINDAELPQQQREHAAFIAKVEQLMDADEYTKQSLQEIVDFLTRWLYHHILSSDMMIGKIIAGEENIFEFSAKYLTGVELIDEEHKKLFEIIERTNEAIHAELLHDKYDEIMNILTELQEYTGKHFGDEEAYMEEIGYPDLPAQKRAHTAFVDKLVDIDLDDRDSIDDNQQEYLEGLIDFLLGWLINHILKMDKLIGEYAREHQK